MLIVLFNYKPNREKNFFCTPIDSAGGLTKPNQSKGLTLRNLFMKLITLHVLVQTRLQEVGILMIPSLGPLMKNSSANAKFPRLIF